MNDMFMTLGVIRLIDLGSHVNPFKKGKVCNCDKCEKPSWLTDKQKGILETLKGSAHIICLHCLKVTENEKIIDIGKSDFKADSKIEEALRSEDGFGGI